MKLAKKILEQSPEEIEAKIIKERMSKFFDKYNDIIDIIPAITVRDNDLKKEFDALDKQVSKILKIFNKKYGK